MTQLNVHQAKTNLSHLLELAERGEEVVIARAGVPVARLVPIAKAAAPRKPGKMKIRIAKDFDAPLPDELARAFGAR